MRHFTVLFASLIAMAAPALAETIETPAQFAYLVDDDTGAVLLNKNADQRMVPSSMTKLMTMYVLDQHLRDGKVKLTDNFTVSEKAWRMQGSKMFVMVGSQVPVEDLIRGIIIQSGNDACIVAAEGLSGSEEAFAQEMNRIAAQIGLGSSHFMNATGWPDPNHFVTAHDLATLAHHVIHDFPDSYRYYAEKSFTYNHIEQANRNRLLGNDIGVDGLKTGHTDEGGYGIVLSAKDPKTARRLILVINGLPSDNARMAEGDKLLRWGLRAFTNHTIAKANIPVDEVPVWFGVNPAVPLVSARDLAVTLPAGSEADVKFALAYTGPLPAPVQKGAHVADLIVSMPGQENQVFPLVAGQDVLKVSGIRKAWETLKAMMLHRREQAPAQ